MNYAKTILRIGVFFSAIYLLILLIMWMSQERSIFLTDVGREPIGTPSDIGLTWQSVTLTTEDDLQLDAWWLPHDEPRASLLFLHGNAGNISHRLPSLAQFHQLGLAVLILDYRGYGRSEGKPSEAGTAMDADAGWRWLKDNSGHDPDRFIIFGRSLGSAVAAELASRTDSAALILESPFRSMPELGQQLYPWLPVKLLARIHYPTAEYVTHREMPLLVIHSKDDELVPFREGEKVYELANPPKQLLMIHGGHNTGFLDSEAIYLQGIDEFLISIGF
ncbi:alpha/beta hydrolase [Nitrincola schmidtii]|uniref:alpha/beta hydrolase n=1 Tax=Nitrincola schmidtii TaxID=1730894 RepID=UPI00124D2087|nr:alpha/beta hydrolase [Nitrincola schmidtii]